MLIVNSNTRGSEAGLQDGTEQTVATLAIFACHFAIHDNYVETDGKLQWLRISCTGMNACRIEDEQIRDHAFTHDTPIANAQHASSE